MQVVDTERSERGRQRRRSGQGRLLHCCCICGHVSVWSEGWSAYCSLKDIDDGVLFPKFCSDKCHAAGGPCGRNVTDAMMRVAKDAELREPNIVYREATEGEKYRAALDAQRDYR